jgi:cytochrome c oxidase subunit 2
VADYRGVTSHRSTYLEVGVAVVEAILLIGFAIPLWAARVDAMPSESEAVVVQVTGEQFAWNIHYPGPDGEFGSTNIKLVSPDNPLGLDRNSMHAADDITTINQLNLPVNRPVIVHLSSKDVIHSFGLPNFRVKQDAIPGMFTPVWFTPNRPGDYEIACSQLCGLGHYRMRGFVTIQSDEDFKKFLEENKVQ